MNALVDECGNRLVVRAAKVKSLEMVETFLRLGADVDTVEHSGDSDLHIVDRSEIQQFASCPCLTSASSHICKSERLRTRRNTETPLVIAILENVHLLILLAHSIDDVNALDNN